MLARVPASPAQGFHHHGRPYFNFPHFYIKCGLEKLWGLLIKTDWRVICRFVAENAGHGRQQQSESIEVALDME